MARVQTYERYAISDIERTVTAILGAKSSVRVKRRRAMEYSRDVLNGRPGAGMAVLVSEMRELP